MHFETVPVEQVIARLKKNETLAVRHGAERRRKTDTKAGAGKRVLSISYDVALLESRQMLLEHHGYAVTSVIGLDAAIEACKRADFDLVILGHSIPSAHKRKMLDQIRAACSVPVLALQRTGDSSLGADAAHTFNPIEGPRAFLAAVDGVFS